LILGGNLVSKMSSATFSSLSRFYLVAGRSVCVQALDEWSALLTKEYLNLLTFTPTSSTKAPENVDCTLRIGRLASPPSIPSGIPNFELAQGRCYVDGESYYLELDGAVIFVRSSISPCAEVYFSESRGAFRQAVWLNTMSYAIQALLRRMNLFHLHAAGVVHPRLDTAALIIGDAGAGKSTLTILLLANGWRYLSDDFLVLSMQEDQVEAQGLRKLFSIHVPSLNGLELPLLNEALGPNLVLQPEKRILDPTVIFPEALVSSCMPRTLFFSELTGEAQSRTRELSQSEAMSRLITQCPWASYDTVVARDYLSLLGRLVKQCKTWQLLAGRDLLDDPTIAATLLSSCMQG
jgi:hypothetical protein